jgi:hypothetical protein
VVATLVYIGSISRNRGREEDDSKDREAHCLFLMRLFVFESRATVKFAVIIL